jgi:hypothetical protein
MGGLAVLLLLGFYFFIGYKIVEALKPKFAKWLVAGILILIPTADAVVGRIYLQRLCATEGGLKVYRVVQGVDGVMEQSREIDDDWVKNHGFQFSESVPVNGLVVRYSRQNGQIIREEKVKPNSLYQVRFRHLGERDVYPRDVTDVVVISTGEILAAYANIGFSGGWAERYLSGFSDAGRSVVAWCEHPMSPVADVVINSLKH